MNIEMHWYRRRGGTRSVRFGGVAREQPKAVPFRYQLVA